MAELPHLQDLYDDYGPRKFVVLALNAYDPPSVIQSYQELYPDVLMLIDPNWGIYNLYEQNGSIPLNYIIDQLQTVVFFMEGFSEPLIRLRIENNLAPVTVILVPDAVTVPQGGTLSFDVKLHNWEDVPYDLLALTEVTLPGGATIPLLGPVPVSLDPGQELSVPISHDIPAGAPLGAYEYEAKLGTFPPPELVDFSIFDFEVVAP